MKIYDKGAWHLDAGLDQATVSQHFELLFHWLSEKNLLNHNGDEIVQLNLYDDASLHSDLLTVQGNDFMEKSYHAVSQSHRYATNDFIKALEDHYAKWNF